MPNSEHRSLNTIIQGIGANLKLEWKKLLRNLIQCINKIGQLTYIHTYNIHIRLIEVDIRNQTENYTLTRRKVIDDEIMLNKVAVTN